MFCMVIKSYNGSKPTANSSCFKTYSRNSTQWNGLSLLPQHFSIQTAAVQWEVSLPRPWDEAPQRASSPNWLPPPASDWHHCTARDIKKDNNSCSFFHILYQPDRHTTVSKLHDKGNYLSLQPNWNQIWVQFKIFSRSLSWQVIDWCILWQPCNKSKKVPYKVKLHLFKLLVLCYS